MKRVEHGAQGGLGHLGAAFDRMLAVHQHLGLDDRHQPGLLRQRGETGERLGVGMDAGGAGEVRADGNHRAPLGEAGAELVVLGQPVAEAVETLGHHLAGGAGEGLGALVDLDAGDDALAAQRLDERAAVGGALAERLVEQDDARDELARAGGGEQDLAVRAAVLLGRFDVDRREALLDRRRRLVGREDPLAGGDQGLGGGFEGVCGHGARILRILAGGGGRTVRKLLPAGSKDLPW